MDTGVVADVFSSVRGTRGKMIRPILLFLAARFGPSYKGTRERLCKLAALTEIVHMASLIHDDIIDDSPLRRGRSTVQARFGKDIAVYAGDFMLSRVMSALAREGLQRSGEILGRTIEEMCRGELGQMACRWDTETTIDAYLKNICGKTAALFIAAAQIGAIECGCDDRDVGYLAGIGENLGYMFQMRDDMLDFISDESREGKPVHKDFSDGIYALPVLYAFGTGSGGRLRVIAAQNADAPDYYENLAEAGELIRGSGGLKFTAAQIKKHAIQARRQLVSIPKRDASAVIGHIITSLSDIDDYASQPIEGSCYRSS